MRLSKLRTHMKAQGIDACVFTSMHCVAYYCGFLYCAFGRSYALVVTASDCVSFSAGIDASQPWRRGYGDNITYTDWQRNNYWRAIRSVTGTGKTLGYEADQLTLAQKALLDEFLTPTATVDISTASMHQRMHKSAAEIALIKAGAHVADVGGYAIKDAIQVGAREIDIAMCGRDAMELEIANKDAGQFFTPPELSELMANLTFGDMLGKLETQPFITAGEPACGAGGMILALVKVMIAEGHNPADRLWVQCIDVDRMAALMCYTQLSLWNVPAEIIVGNTLSWDIREVWYTPAHHMGFWKYRLHRNAESLAVDITASERPFRDAPTPSSPLRQTDTQKIKPSQLGFDF